jgi:Plasmid replication region DNA-binding N-term
LILNRIIQNFRETKEFFKVRLKKMYRNATTPAIMGIIMGVSHIQIQIYRNTLLYKVSNFASKMPRSSQITYEQVAQACNDIAADGRKPTYKELFAIVGGSYEVIKRLLTRWLEEASAAQKYALPDELARDLGAWYQKAVHQARAEAELWRQDQEVLMQAERQALAKAEGVAEATQRQALDSMQSIGHENSLLTVQLSHAQSRGVELDIRVTNFEAKLANQTAKALAAERTSSERAQEIERLSIRHSHALELAETRTRETERVLLLRHGSEVQAFKTRAEKAEAELMHTKEIRDALQQRANKLAEELADAKGRLQGLTKRDET